MTATNHALTGTVIGLAVGQPVVAIPLALASHFICDALPHYKSSLSDDKLLKSLGFRNYLMAEAGICGLIVLVLAVLQPQNWLLAAVCAFVAAAPDLAWIPRYVQTRQGKKWHPNSFEKFTANIQWFQRPIGWTVEAAWLVAAITVLIPFVG